MAKIKKRKICWEASTSPQVIGYKLYWAVGNAVNYDCESISVGNVTELVFPDEVASFAPCDGSVEFAVAAVDELGNESDLITLSAPYQFSVPQAPKDLWIENTEENHTVHEVREDKKQPEPISLFDKRTQHLEDESAAEGAKIPMMARGALKYQVRISNTHSKENPSERS